MYIMILFIIIASDYVDKRSDWTALMIGFVSDSVNIKKLFQGLNHGAYGVEGYWPP